MEAWEHGVIYAVNDAGERVLCPHPLEAEQVARVLGIPPRELRGFPHFRIPNPEHYDLLNTRVSVLVKCMCHDCTHAFRIDWDQDPHECPKCHSSTISIVDRLEGTRCPQCNQGLFEYRPTGVIS